MSESPIILAIDTTDLDVAEGLITQTYEYISVYKLGLEFYLKHGLAGIAKLRSRQDFKCFLDLKLHDIPNTVSKAVKAVAEIKPFILTVHASGGAEMIKAAVEALPNTQIAAVTILTSLDQPALDQMGFGSNTEQMASSLAATAKEAGAQALVASALEVSSLKERFPDLLMITPGIRPIDTTSKDDQRRVMSPREAIESGSDYLVIGRPITEAPSPREAAKAILSSLA